jgi:hypothetical protein
MTKTVVRLLVCGMALGGAAAASAQTPAAPGINATPPVLLIYREEVRPGKGAAHEANETAWASAYRQGQAPLYWLGMTSMAGPSEAWFLSGYGSFADMQRAEDAIEQNAALRAESNKFSGNEAELLSRVSTIVARYRPALSYQADVRLPDMRFMSVQMVRVKPGRVDEFWEAWEMVVEAHKKAKMDEHWAVYQVDSGLLDTTFLFLYPRKSMAEVDASGPMHGAAGYRDAIGEAGRAKLRAANQSAIEASQTMHFRMQPGMSTLSQAWADADAFWAPKASPVAAKANGKKKK